VSVSVGNHMEMQVRINIINILVNPILGLFAASLIGHKTDETRNFTL